MKETLRDFLAFLRLNRNASAHTVRAYDGDLSQFLSYLSTSHGRPRPELTPGDITRPAIRGFLAELFRQGKSRASAARKLAAIRTFLRYLRREGLIDADPGLLVATPKREQKVPRHLEVDEMTQLIETPDTTPPLGRRDRAILELLYASGLRLSELVGLDLEDVNLSSRMVRVLGKGRKERIVPFNRTAAEALRAWLPDREALVRRRSRAAPAASERSGRERDARRAAAAAAGPAARGRAVRELSRHAAVGPQRPPAGAPTTSPRAAPASASARTRSATPSRRTCCRRARTSGRSRNCWGTSG